MPIRPLRPSRRGTATFRTVLLLLLLLIPVSAAAHTALRSATPGDGDTLSAVPEAIRLSFTGAVELPLSAVRMVGPDGAEVALAPPELAGGSDRELVARIAGPLRAGSYTVSWQTASTDGHPVRGEFSFVIAEGAQGIAAPVAAPEPPSAPGAEAGAAPAAAAPPTTATAPAFGVDSPLYVGVRWLTFLGLLGVIGAVAFRAPVLWLLGRRCGEVADRVAEPAARRAAAIGVGAAGLLLAALLLRLFAQSYAVYGAGPLGEGRLGALLGGTTWGWGWILQGVGTLLALLGLWLASKGSGAGWGAAALGAVVLALSPALSGHAAAVPTAPATAVAADALHVLGAGGWLGSLLVVMAVGVPAVRRLPAAERGTALRGLVDAFSSTALAFAAVVVLTGLLAAWLHLPSVSALWGSAYGRTLLLKLAVLAVVFGAGAYNWRRVRPALAEGDGAGRLRRSASVELAAGALVLLVTAVLVATPPPHEEVDSAPTVAVEP